MSSPEPASYRLDPDMRGNVDRQSRVAPVPAFEREPQSQRHKNVGPPVLFLDERIVSSAGHILDGPRQIADKLKVVRLRRQG